MANINFKKLLTVERLLILIFAAAFVVLFIQNRKYNQECESLQNTLGDRDAEISRLKAEAQNHYEEYNRLLWALDSTSSLLRYGR